MATYALHKSKYAAAPEDTFNIVLATTGVSDGTTIPYSVSGIDSSDITEPLTGNFTVNNNSASTTFTVNSAFIGSKEFRLDLVGVGLNHINVVIAQDAEYICDPTFVFTADSFNDWRRKHNCLDKKLRDVEIAAQARGVRKQHYDATAAQTIFFLNTKVNPTYTLVTVNGNTLDNTDYTLTTDTFTYSSSNYTLQENDDINFYDFATGGGVAIQHFDATAAQTVFNLSPNVNPDHCLVSINGNILDNTDYGLTPTTLTYSSSDYTIEQDDDVNIYDYSNGNLFGYNRVIKDGVTIVPNRGNMKFVGNVTITDSSSTDETIIDIGSTGGSGGSSGTGEATVLTITAANTFSIGNVVCANGASWQLSDASDPTKSEVLGVVTAASTSSFSIVTHGKLTLSSHGFSVGADLFLSETSGQISESDVAASSSISKPIGSVLDINNIHVNIVRGVSGSPIGTDSWTIISGTTTAVAGGNYFISPSDTLNLPTNPSNNDSVVISQGSGDLSATSATVYGGTKNISDNINTNATNWSVDDNFTGRFTFVYNSTLAVWKVT